MHFLLPHFPYFPHYDEGPLFRPYLPLKPFFSPSGSSLHQLHDPAVVQDVRVTFIYGIYIPYVNRKAALVLCGPSLVWPWPGTK